MKNPIPDILNSIPFTESILDLELADTLKAHFEHSTSNSFLLGLLKALEDAGLVKMATITSVITPGNLVTIKRL